MTPTIGQMVWIVRNETHSVQPEAGLVCFVHNERLINVAGFNANGAIFSMTSLLLVQGEEPPEQGDYAMLDAKKATRAAADPPAGGETEVKAEAAANKKAAEDEQHRAQEEEHNLTAARKRHLHDEDKDETPTHGKKTNTQHSKTVHR
jgi:hypothetical protein